MKDDVHFIHEHAAKAQGTESSSVKFEMEIIFNRKL